MTVFVVHEPVSWDRDLRCMVPLDLTPAAKFGPLLIILPGLDRPPSAQEALPLLKAAMCAFRSTDYLVVAGDMDLVVWTSALALKNTGGKLRLLRWNSRSRHYDIFDSPDGLLTETRAANEKASTESAR